MTLQKIKFPLTSATALALLIAPLQLSLKSVDILFIHRSAWYAPELFVFAVLGWLAFQAVRGRLHHTSRSVVQLSLLLTLTVIIISLTREITSASLLAIMRLLLGIWLLPLVSHVLKQFGKHRTVFLIMCILALHAQWGITQFILQQDLGLYYLGETQLDPHQAGIAKFAISTDHTKKIIRSYGPYPHPNSLAGSLVVGLILAAAYAHLYPTRAFIPPLYILYLATLLTFSRASWLAAAVTVCIHLIMNYTHRPRSTLSVRAILTLIALTLFVFTPLIYDRFIDQEDQAVADRQQGVQYSLALSKRHLWQGIGIGQYPAALDQHLQSTDIPHDPWQIAPVHSVPLLLLVEWGIVGATLAVGSLILYVKAQKFPSASLFLLAIFPPLLLDHYFLTQTAPLGWLAALFVVLLHHPASQLSPSSRAAQSAASTTRAGVQPP